MVPSFFSVCHILLSPSQANAAGAALVTRFSELSPDLEKMQKKNREGEQKLAKALKEMDSLKTKLGQAEKGLEDSQVQLASTRSELDQEKKGVAKLKEEHAFELSGAIGRERKKAVRDFLCSYQFADDVACLNLPILQIGVTRTLEKVKGLNPPGFNLADFKDYNPAAEEKLNWLFNGYCKGHALKDLVGRSDVGTNLAEVPLEEGETSDRALGKEPVA